MADKILLDPDEVKLRLGLSDEIDIAESLELAIRAAQAAVEAELQTSIQRIVGREDLFYVDSDEHSGVQIGGLFRLLLTNGFVVGGSPIVTYGDSWNTASSAVDSSLMRLDLDRGLVYVDASEYSSKYVKVVYTSGFTSGTAMPDWLKEVITLRVPDALKMNQPKDPATENTNKAGKSLRLDLMESRVRNIGFCLRPLVK